MRRTAVWISDFPVLSAFLYQALKAIPLQIWGTDRPFPCDHIRKRLPHSPSWPRLGFLFLRQFAIAFISQQICCLQFRTGPHVAGIQTHKAVCPRTEFCQPLGFREDVIQFSPSFRGFINDKPDRLARNLTNVQKQKLKSQLFGSSENSVSL